MSREEVGQTFRLTVPIEVKMDTDEIIERLKKDDFVPVVRCKECKYFYKASKYCSEFLTADEDGFCAWGERRDDEQTH